MRPDHLEVVGVNAINKGAELMLHAVAQQQDAHLTGWRIAVAQDALSFDARSRARVRQRVRFDRLGPLGPRAGDLLPHRVREPLGLVGERQIAAILDASGFAYSSEQRLAPFEARVRAYRRARRRGQRIVLLPQAFGPFDTDRTRQLGAALLAQTDLAIARDEASEEALRAVVGDAACRIERAPDFTGLVHVEATRAEVERFAGRVAVVPNTRMVDRVEPAAATAYRELLVAVLDRLAARGARPFVLVVNAKKDAELVRALEPQLDQPLEIVEPDDPLAVKRILGVCGAVVASRFHALVASLGQGVPALALGWSHKYPALLAEHDAAELLLDVEQRDEVLATLEQLLRPEVRTQWQQRLLPAAGRIDAATHRMWETVAATLAR